MAKGKDILKEAIAEANEIKRAAYENASSIISESLKDNLKNFVNEQLNEEYEEMEEAYMSEEPELDFGDEAEEDEDENDEFDFGSDEEDEDEDDMMDEGLTEEDLEEAVNEALAAISEVEHGDLGEMEFVEPSKHADSRGIEDFDSKEKGWEEEEGEAAGSTELYGKKGPYHQESKKLISKLVSENKMLKKTNAVLRKNLEETNLFNRKVYFTNKLLQKEGASLDMKKKIIEQMDKVKTSKEAQRLYEVYNTVLGQMSDKAKSGKGKKSLSESLGLRLNENKETPKSNSINERFAILAGLKEEDY